MNKEYKFSSVFRYKDFKKSGIYLINIKDEYGLTKHSYVGSSKKINERLSTHRKLLRSNKHYNKILQNTYNKYSENNLFVSILETVNEEDLLIKEKHWIDVINPDINIIKDPTMEERIYLYNGHGSKKVYQFDLEGNLINSYESVSEAARQTGFSKEGINHAANPNRIENKSSNGYLWSYNNTVNSYINNSCNAKNSSINVLNLDTLQEDNYNKIADFARALNKNKFNSVCAKISCACKRGYLLYNKYLVKYTSDNKYKISNTKKTENSRLYARLKFRESGKLHLWTTLIQD